MVPGTVMQDESPRRGLILAACMMATFTAAVETTIVATAMPTIVADLDGAALYSWVFSAYLLTQAVTIPIYGRLADLHGRKTIFIAGASLFLLGSVLCGLSTSIATLILFRAVQGCGAGAVQPIAYTIVGDIYSPVERARIQGMLSAVFGFAAIAGPTLGAVLVRAGSWRLVFWINLPVIIAAIAMVAVFLRENHAARPHRRIDLAGAALLTIGIGAAVLAADRWRQLGGINMIVAAIAGLIAILGLIHHERRTPEPMIPAAFWRNRVIIIGALGGFTVGATIMSVTAFLPSFVQAAMGQSAGMAGLVIGTMVVVWTLGSVAAGRLMVHVSYRVTGCAGAAAMIAGSALLLALGPNSSIAHAAAGASLVGVGLGFCNTTWVVSVQTRVRYDQRGSATSAIMFTRFLGQALGAAVAGIILTFALELAAPGIADPLGRLLGSGDPGAVPDLDVAALRLTVAHAFRGIFAMTAIMGLATLALASQLPRGLGAGAAARPGR
jgi:EmrB/QacA subfamily drug resistance transporter